MRIVFFDCDGTLTTVKSSWQYLHERLGLWDSLADEYQRLFYAGKIDYGEFCRRDAALWKGLPEERIRRIVDDIPLHEGVQETMEALRAEGILTVLLSTGLSLLVDRVRRDLGMTHGAANDLVVRDGVVTGEVKIHVDHDAGREASGAAKTPTKGYWVKKILKEQGIRKEEAAAVGDGEGDRAMFQEVGLALGYHPSPGILPLLDHAFENGSFKEILGVLTRRR